MCSEHKNWKKQSQWEHKNLYDLIGVYPQVTQRKSTSIFIGNEKILVLKYKIAKVAYSHKIQPSKAPQKLSHKYNTNCTIEN